MKREKAKKTVKQFEEEKTFTLTRCPRCKGLFGSGWQTRYEATIEFAKHAMKCKVTR